MSVTFFELPLVEVQTVLAELGENCFFFSVLAAQKCIQSNLCCHRIRFFVPAHSGVALYPESSESRDVKKYAHLNVLLFSFFP